MAVQCSAFAMNKTCMCCCCCSCWLHLLNRIKSLCMCANNTQTWFQHNRFDNGEMSMENKTGNFLLHAFPFVMKENRKRRTCANCDSNIELIQRVRKREWWLNVASFLLNLKFNSNINFHLLLNNVDVNERYFNVQIDQLMLSSDFV